MAVSTKLFSQSIAKVNGVMKQQMFVLTLFVNYNSSLCSGPTVAYQNGF